jgi:hypothetical protein
MQDKDNKISPENTVKENGAPGLSLDTIRSHANGLIHAQKDLSNEIGIFNVKTASAWMEEAKLRPIPKMLFGELWFEGELCILFADTNLGKSILAVQIGDSISKGEPIKAFKLEAQKQSILYFDFELSDKQFEARYSMKFQGHYEFDDNFIRAEMNPEKSDHTQHGFETFEEYLYDSLEQSIIESGAKVLIIDNITYLKDETEKAKFALPLMKLLQALKKRYGLSILTLAHTPKRDLSKPITRNDLSGSKMLINFCDSSFSIGESHSDKNIRYLKQIKSRNTEIIFDSENICVCQIEKPNNFLRFDLLNYGTEREHLKQYSEQDKDSLNERVLELNKQGKSLREIGTELSVSHMKVRRILDKCNKV